VRKFFRNAPELSYKTKADYEKDLRLAIRQLHQGGYQVSGIGHLKRKHVDYLLDTWKSQQLHTGTIKNRLARLRYVFRKIKKIHLFPKYNAELGVAPNIYKPVRNRAIHEIAVEKIGDPHVSCSVRLQQQFGLRREESMKFIVSQADRGDHIALKGSWTKGGIARKVPVIKGSQRELLADIRKLVGEGRSLIPVGKKYIQQENTYVAKVRNAGFHNLHGLRHAYAQQRYRDLVNEMTNNNGWESPINGGKKYLDMEPWEKNIDTKARRIVSNELGHSRIGVTVRYLA